MKSMSDMADKKLIVSQRITGLTIYILFSCSKTDHIIRMLAEGLGTSPI